VSDPVIVSIATDDHLHEPTGFGQFLLKAGRGDELIDFAKMNLFR
jgi:hypothetical protein